METNNRTTAMGRSLPIMVTKRAGQIECKRVVKWSAISHNNAD